MNSESAPLNTLLYQHSFKTKSTLKFKDKVFPKKDVLGMEFKKTIIIL